MDHASRLKQAGIYFQRCRRGFVYEKGWKILISVVLITLILCMVTGSKMYVSYGATRNGSFALVCACIWIGIFNSIRTICREREILKKEHRTGLHMSAYTLAHWGYELLLCLIEAVPVTLIVRLVNLSHFTEDGVLFPPTLELFISFFLIIFSSDALGLLISAIVKNENVAMTVMPFALIIQLVMSGLIFPLEGVTKSISAGTISRWGLDALCAGAGVNNMPRMAAVEAIAEYDSTPENLIFLWGLLFGFAVLYGILTALVLELIDKY